MSSPWDGERFGIRVNKDIEEMLENNEFKKHLEAEYEGVTDFFETKMREELNEVPTLKDKIKSLKSERNQIDNEIKKLEQKRERQKKHNKLRDKEKRLKQIQSDIQALRNEDIKSEEELREEKHEKASKISFGPDQKFRTEEEFVEHAVQKELEKQPNRDNSLEELLSEAENLQKELADLKGGREKWFLDLNLKNKEVDVA